MGHSIVGDRRYGAATDPIDRVCLHATELGLAHPATGQTMRFNSPMPREFGKLVGGLSTLTGAEAAASVRTHMAAEVHDAGATVAQSSAVAKARKTGATSWDHVAEWYTELIEERRSDHHEVVILPGTVRLLAAKTGMRVLDVACGQGVLARRLSSLGVEAVGIDASPKLIEAAKRATAGDIPAPRFLTGDARDIGGLDIGAFDGAACVMALMNIEPMAPVLEGVAARLRTGGVFVAVVLHPAFRAPGQTSWGWEEERQKHRGEETQRRRDARVSKAPTSHQSEIKQYRRVDGYLTPGQSPIVMNPGAVARGQAPVTTMTFHRPIQAYVNAFAKAGLLVDAMEEWPSLRSSQPGPRAAEENRARREIPMFLALRGVKIAR
jgi:2-polyprenyl-3-methyl-5-hydroxy-6-metoxy-1,4-benzoquinol methylase